MADEQRHVFVSYTRDQDRIADALVDQFRASGAEPSSVDESGAGSDWRAQLDESIESADAFVVLIGNEPSRYAREEWAAVLEQSWADPDKPVVAILGPDATLPPAFADRQTISLADADNVDAQVAELVPAIFAAFRNDHGHAPALDSTWNARLDEIQSVSRTVDDEPDEA